MDKVKKWFFEDEDDDEEYEAVDTIQEETVKTTSMFEKPKSNKTTDVVKVLNANRDHHLILFEPRAYSDTQEIATYLKQKRGVVVNLHRLQKEQSKRVIDFLSGVIFAIEGDIQQLDEKVFLCTPKNISVGGSISMENKEEE